MSSLPTVVLLLVFAGAAAVIWGAGIQLSDYTDVLAERLHLGAALGGLILLAVATNLPEIAITISAAAAGDVEVAVGNILGGIAIQTVVLVAVDAFGVSRRTPLTYVASSLTLVLEALLVAAVLAVVVAGSQLPSSVERFRVEPGPLLVLVIWLVGLRLVSGPGRRLPWSEHGEAPDSQSEARGHSQKKTAQSMSERGVSTARAATVFGTAAVLTLVAGVLLERSGEQAFGNLGLTGVLFGSTVLAAATSLPELSTGLASARNGDPKLAMSDIFGGNAFLPVLFVMVPLISDQAVLPRAEASDVYLTALGILLTLVYAVGLIFRPQRHVLRMGADSLTVLVLYALGVVGLVVLT